MRMESRPRESRPLVNKKLPEAWPFYIVYDVSQSMWDPAVHGGYTPWHVMRDSVPDLIREVSYIPQAKDTCHTCLITFADDAKVLLPLTRLSQKLVVPSLPQGTETNFAKVFKLLATAVRDDYQKLSRNYHVKSPAVYFVTDGVAQAGGKLQPESAWRPELRKLHSLDCQPIVVALGLGEAEEQALCLIKANAGPACVAGEHAVPAQLLKAIVFSIIKSVVNSTDRGEFAFDLPPDMRRLSC